MALAAHLSLSIEGIFIEGESTVASLDREGTIECSSFSFEGSMDYSPTDFRITDRPKFSPIVIKKRIDKTTPLLIRALFDHQTVDTASFRFFRPSLGGASDVEHFYTVLGEKGYVLNLKQISEDAIVAGEKAPPMMEEISFGFHEITWTYEIGGATHKEILPTR